MSSQETDRQSIGDRLKLLREEAGLSQTDIAGEIGRSQQTWGAYEAGDSTPPVSVIQKLLVRFEVNAQWLLTGVGGMEKPASKEDEPSEQVELFGDVGSVPDDFEPDDVAYVPVYGAPLGAGGAGNASMRKVRGYMAWERTWLRRQARIDPAKAFVAQVYGQSMEDLIESGDLVLGEMQKVVDHDGIYAVRLDDELFVKHVMRRESSILLVSENDIYDRIRVHEHDDFAIIGRVVARVGSV